jgi:hypothetical protein
MRNLKIKVKNKKLQLGKVKINFPTSVVKLFCLFTFLHCRVKIDCLGYKLLSLSQS